MVFVDRVTDDRDCWSVVVDDDMGGRLGMEHLISRGHTAIAFVGHPQNSVKVSSRLRGARGAIKDSGAKGVELELITVDSWTVQAGKEAAELIAKRPPALRPTAVFCANDMMALGMLQTFERAGMAVPTDIAIVGYDDLAWSEISMIPLTTVRQPRHLLGYTAVEMIMELLDHPNQKVNARHVVLDPELIVREST